MAYPSSLDNFTRRSDGQTIYGAHVNELQAAIEAIEAELGLSPSGSDPTVAQRLAAITAALAAPLTLDGGTA